MEIKVGVLMEFQAARHMLQVSLAIYESGRTGRTVRPDSML